MAGVRRARPMRASRAAGGTRRRASSARHSCAVNGPTARSQVSLRNDEDEGGRDRVLYGRDGDDGRYRHLDPLFPERSSLEAARFPRSAPARTRDPTVIGAVAGLHPAIAADHRQSACKANALEFFAESYR
jgi:hypothetical protein